MADRKIESERPLTALIWDPDLPAPAVEAAADVQLRRPHRPQAPRQVPLLYRQQDLHRDHPQTRIISNETRPFTLKYQLPNEDLDSLITVSTDKDLDNMIDEHDCSIY
ncbi:hypothetical protein CDL15_Pgr001922 [Punica granatum]|uniref:PB1 domain-containing protein n=1 Tax=Punica granatum TaxID=22663 RepID=A0A218XC37_PUNGR|nr:hypothetical protein CDL15_Pgr001922 [Punica granatum]